MYFTMFSHRSLGFISCLSVFEINMFLRFKPSSSQEDGGVEGAQITRGGNALPCCCNTVVCHQGEPADQEPRRNRQERRLCTKFRVPHNSSRGCTKVSVDSSGSRCDEIGPEY